MNERSSGLWIVLLVALAGVLHVAPIGSQAPAAGSNQAPAPAKPSPPAPNIAESAVLKELAAYYNGIPLDDKTCSPFSGSSRPSVVQKGKSGCAPLDRFHNSGSRVVIALVPDPVDAHAAYRFDETLEALQTGAQDAGYLLDRFSLNWPRSNAAAPADAQSAARESFRTTPAVVIFRPSEPSQRENVLVVLVVGETPTSGVHKQALLSALRLSRTLIGQAKDMTGDASKLRVIGPNFSGSVVSIQQAVAQWADDFSDSVQVHFISGNSTVLNARRDLEDKPYTPTRVSLRFHATVLPDNVLDDAIYGYLSSIGVTEEDIAVLTEADSSYGQEFVSAAPGGTTMRRFAYSLPYPMHISQVRTLQQDASVPGGAISIGDNPMHAALHLSSDEASDPRDKPPLYSPGPDANLAELSLTNIINTLNIQHIRYVGLFGTDTRDKLFLARLIRSYHPNIQFFTNDSDILFAHPNFTADLWGMLIASTYPLVTQSQTWIHDLVSMPTSPQVIRQFSSQSGQSVHNATCIAVGRTRFHHAADFLMMRDDRDDRGDDECRRIVDYDYPLYASANAKLPVVWITAVGNGSIWPVAIHDPWNQKPASPLPIRINIQRSRTFLLTFLMLTAFCVVNCLVYLDTKRRWAIKPFPHRKHRMFEPVALNTPGKYNWQAFTQRLGILGYFVFLLFLYTAITVVVLLPSQYDGLLLIAIRGIALLSIFVLAVAVHESLRSLMPAASERSPSNLLIAFDAAVVLAVFAWFIEYAPPNFDVQHLMLYERATRLGNGLSPILPLFFLSFGVCIWLLCFLRRAQLTVYLHNVNPYGDSPRNPFFRLYDRVSDAMRGGYGGLPKWGWSALAGLIAVTIFAALWANFFSTIENRYRVDWILFGFFSVLIAGLFWSACHCLAIWIHLRRLLRLLAFHRIFDAFHELPRKLAHGLSTNLMDSRPTLAELDEHLRTLAGIRDQFSLVEIAHLTDAQKKCLPADLDDQSVRAISMSLARERSLAASRRILWHSLPTHTQKQFCDISRELFQRLTKYWDKDPFQAASNLSKESKNAVAEGFKLCEKFVASQIVAHLNYVFMNLRYLFACTALSVVFLLLATSSYPFRTQNLMMNFSWVLVLFFAAMYLAIFMQMERTEVLRAIADEKGKHTFNRAIISQAVLFGVIPLLTFLGSKFPALGRIIFAWAGPAVKALNF